MANALTLIMPLKEGIGLQQIGGLIGAALPKINDALASIGTVHFARFVVLDPSTPNLQPGPTGPYKLAIITTEAVNDFDYVSRDPAA